MAATRSALATAGLQAGIDRACRSSLDGSELLHALAGRIRGAVPCAGLLLLRTDPTTVLPTDGVVHNLPPALCKRFWDNELLEDDYAKFVDLSRREPTAAILSVATGGDLARSRRYTALYRPLGLGDELRVSFTARDGSCWGIAQLVRADGEVFSEGERDLLAGVSAQVAEGLRATFAARPPTPPGSTGPALVILDGHGEVRAVTAEAEHWLGELVRSSTTGMAPVPEAAYLVAGRARAARAGLADEPASVQVRTRSGVWLRLHASCLEAPGSAGADVAVVITPASAPDLARLIALAYRLTAREQEVLQFLARGLTTSETAQQLGISHHTVRDHVKALFAKVGVRSRAELVARVFADHYFAPLQAGAEVLDRPPTPP